MKYNLLIEGRSFEVEIEDINTRPVVARVNGLEFLVQPQQSALEKTMAEPPQPEEPAIIGNIAMQEGALVAPLPGIVIEVFVKVGTEIEAGQVILIIEAMKMKNTIRSIQAGRVAAVLVKAGDTVSHRQRLVEFQK